MQTWVRAYRLAVLTAFVVFLGVFVSFAGATSFVDWPTYLFNNQHSSYNSAATVITPGDVGTLTPAWKFDGPSTGSPPGRLYASPTVYGGKIYVGSNSGEFYRIDETTGAVDWHENLGTSPALTCRGKGILSTATVATDPATGALTVYVGAGDGNVDALRASDGQVIWQTPVNVDSGGVNDKYNFSSPLVDRGRVYQGISSSCDQPLTRGGLVELDQSTGSLLHTYYTVPQGSIGGSIWSSPAITPDGSTVFVTIGNGDPASGANQGDSISIVKLNADTLAKEDIWTVPIQPPNDSDFGGSPTLFTATVNGVSTPMVGAINKNDFYYAWKQSDLAGGPVWQDKIGTNGDVAAAIWDGSHLFVAGGKTVIDGHTYAGAVRELDPSTGQPIWETGLTAGGVGFGSPTLDGGGVIGVVTYDPSTGASNTAYLLSAGDGSIVRTISLTSPTFAQPVFADQYLFVTDGAAADLYAYSKPVSSDTDFSVEQNPSANPVVADHNLTYSMTVTNSGAAAAATLIDAPPPRVIIRSVTPSQGTCSDASPISCSLGSIGQGGSATVQLIVTPISPGMLTNSDTVTPSDGTPSDNTSTVMTSVRAQAQTKYVSVDESGYTPSAISTQAGRAIQWSFYSGGHSAIDGDRLGCTGSAPCALFDSGVEPKLSYFRQPFVASGTYLVSDSGSSNTGIVQVSTQVAPLTGSAADTFTVTWASQAAGTNQVFDIQVKEPGSKAWTPWKTGVTAPSGSFNSGSPGWMGSGTYHFRTRLRNSSSDKASGYSPGSKALTIS